MIGESRSEFRLKNPPEDGISSVKFGPSSSQFLLVSSWDCSVRLYDVQANSMRTKYTHDRPVLDVSFQVDTYYIIKLFHYMVKSTLFFNSSLKYFRLFEFIVYNYLNLCLSKIKTYY